MAKVATIDKKKCPVCPTCRWFCEQEAIIEEGNPGHEYMAVDKEKCNGCEACLDVCPNGAISMAE